MNFMGRTAMASILMMSILASCISDGGASGNNGRCELDVDTLRTAVHLKKNNDPSIPEIANFMYSKNLGSIMVLDNSKSCIKVVKLKTHDVKRYSGTFQPLGNEVQARMLAAAAVSEEQERCEKSPQSYMLGLPIKIREYFYKQRGNELNNHAHAESPPICYVYAKSQLNTLFIQDGSEMVSIDVFRGDVFIGRK